MPDLSLDDTESISLCEVLDRVLNKGIVVAGDVVISVADIDLIYLGLQLVLASAETAREMTSSRGECAAIGLDLRTSTGRGGDGL